MNGLQTIYKNPLGPERRACKPEMKPATSCTKINNNKLNIILNGTNQKNLTPDVQINLPGLSLGLHLHYCRCDY